MMKLFFKHSAIGNAVMMAPILVTLICTYLFGIVALKLIIGTFALGLMLIIIGAIIGAIIEDHLPDKIRNWIRK